MWFISGLVFSCQRDLNTACPPIQKITVQTGCYDQQTGLALKAVGNFDSIATVILWKFYIGKDSTVGLSPSALRIFQGRKSIKLPDSLLTNQQVVNVNAQFNCNGKMYDSYYYSFVKESAGGCVRWVLHNP
jgi:hypothetical protein